MPDGFVSGRDFAVVVGRYAHLESRSMASFSEFAVQRTTNLCGAAPMRS
jgi:hypothetical protein